MHQPQKGRSSKQSKATKLKFDQEMMGILAKCIAEVLHDDSQSIQEPFELYAHQLRMQLYHDVKIFHSRFIQGYEALLEHFQSKKSS